MARSRPPGPASLQQRCGHTSKAVSEGPRSFTMETSVSSVTLIRDANDVPVPPAAHAAGSVDPRVGARPFFQERANRRAVAQPHVTHASARADRRTTASSIYPSPAPLQMRPDLGRCAPRPSGPVSLPVISNLTVVERLNLRIDRAPPCPASFVFQAQDSTGDHPTNKPISRFGSRASLRCTHITVPCLRPQGFARVKGKRDRKSVV